MLVHERGKNVENSRFTYSVPLLKLTLFQIDFDKIEIINKDLKYLKLTFHDICPCDMSIIINKSNKPFCHISSQCEISTSC